MTRFQQKTMSLLKAEMMYDETKSQPISLALIYTLGHVQNNVVPEKCGNIISNLSVRAVQLSSFSFTHVFERIQYLKIQSHVIEHCYIA